VDGKEKEMIIKLALTKLEEPKSEALIENFKP
jgi:hypothetical protein